MNPFDVHAQHVADPDQVDASAGLQREASYEIPADEYSDFSESLAETQAYHLE